MKRRSLVFFSLAACFLTAGLLSAQRVFYVLLFCQLAVLTAGALINLWAAFSFTYTQELSSNSAIRGESVQLSLTIHNEKPLPFPLLRCRINLAENKSKELSFGLAARAFVDFSLEVPCQHRGHYQVGLAAIDFVDLFGLWRMPFQMRLLPYYRPKELLVYPQLARLNRLNLPGLTSSAKPGRQMQDDSQYPYAMTRKYQFGDRLSQIHWQAFSRQRTLLTRLYDSPAESGLELVLDLHAADYQGLAARQAQDIFCEIAAAVVFYLLGQKRPVLVKACAQKLTHFPLAARTDFLAFHKWLATVEFTAKSSLVQHIRPAAGSSQLILTSRFDPDLAQLLQKLSFVGNKQLIIAAPARDSLFPNEAKKHYQAQKLPALLIHFASDLAAQLEAGQ